MDNNKFKGTVSLGYYSLQLQLKSLLEEAGSDQALQLLDSIAELSRAERSLIIPLMIRLIDQVKEGDLRLVSKDEASTKALEDALLADITKAIKTAANGPSLAVIDGGKKKTVINIDQARKAKAKSEDQLLA